MEKQEIKVSGMPTSDLFTFVIAMLYIFFIGEPDLHSALIHFLMK